MSEPLPDLPVHWLYLPTLLRVGPAVGAGVFVGLEREHNGKAGARTFTFAAPLGCLGGLMATPLRCRRSGSSAGWSGS